MAWLVECLQRVDRVGGGRRGEGSAGQAVGAIGGNRETETSRRLGQVVLGADGEV